MCALGARLPSSASSRWPASCNSASCQMAAASLSLGFDGGTSFGFLRRGPITPGVGPDGRPAEVCCGGASWAEDVFECACAAAATALRALPHRQLISPQQNSSGVSPGVCEPGVRARVCVRAFCAWSGTCKGHGRIAAIRCGCLLQSALLASAQELLQPCQLRHPRATLPFVCNGNGPGPKSTPLKFSPCTN